MITKRAYEEFFRYHDFQRSDGNGWLNTDETLTSGTVTAADKLTAADVSATMISSVSVYASTKMKYMLKAGTSGRTYVITIRVVTSNGQKFEDQVEVKVA